MALQLSIVSASTQNSTAFGGGSRLLRALQYVRLFFDVPLSEGALVVQLRCREQLGTSMIFDPSGARRQAVAKASTDEDKQAAEARAAALEEAAKAAAALAAGGGRLDLHPCCFFAASVSMRQP